MYTNDKVVKLCHGSFEQLLLTDGSAKEKISAGNSQQDPVSPGGSKFMPPPPSVLDLRYLEMLNRVIIKTRQCVKESIVQCPELITMY